MGWIGNILIWLGLWLVGRKDRKAFLFTIVGELVWVAYAAYYQWWDLSLSCIVFAAISAKNWVIWGRDSDAERELLRKESRLNHEGYWFRNDFILREGDDGYAPECEEGYSLCTFRDGFQREAIYGGSREFAINRAYDEFIIGSGII